jgi:hypothetical protein
MDKLKLSDYGRIIKEYYLLASSSSNGTWFLESEAFKQGEYSKEDYLELVNDIEKMRASGVNDIDLIIEVAPFDNMQGDVAVTFYGSFYDLFERPKATYHLLGHEDYEIEI